MSPYDDNSVGLSLLLYMAALFAVLALVVVPVYLANKGTVEKNTGITAGAAFPRSDRRRFPVTHLTPATIVDPAQIAKLNGEAQKANHPRPTDQAIAAQPAAPTNDSYTAAQGATIGGPSSLRYDPVLVR